MARLSAGRESTKFWKLCGTYCVYFIIFTARVIELTRKWNWSIGKTAVQRSRSLLNIDPFICCLSVIHVATGCSVMIQRAEGVWTVLLPMTWCELCSEWEMRPLWACHVQHAHHVLPLPCSITLYPRRLASRRVDIVFSAVCDFVFMCMCVSAL